MNKCEKCEYVYACTLQKMPEYDCCETCVYALDCLIRGDLVHWCKAYAEIDSHERLHKIWQKEEVV
jgi:hypothetical protein